MSRYRVLVCAALSAAVLMLASLPAGAGSGAAARDTDHARVRYLVTLRAGAGTTPGALSKAAGARPTHVYRHALDGFAAELTAAQVRRLESDPRVARVEPDARVYATAQVLPWGINQIDADVSSTLAGDGSGAVDVDVYVIDTGADSTHRDLAVVEAVDFTGTGNAADCNGHGTHVSGTIAARDDTNDVVGAVPAARIHAVKVLDCKGSGWQSNVIAGIDWVTANAAKPAVANMSLGGSASSALDDAVRRLAASGVPVAVAAGNNSRNACNYSPARAGAGTNNGVITVGAIDSRTRAASFSNYGSCVDVWAPGVSIVSTRLGGGTVSMSGTSMAAPHVAGTAALWLSSYPSATASQAEAQVRADSVVSAYRARDKSVIRMDYAGRY